MGTRKAKRPIPAGMVIRKTTRRPKEKLLLEFFDFLPSGQPGELRKKQWKSPWRTPQGNCINRLARRKAVMPHRAQRLGFGR